MVDNVFSKYGININTTPSPEAMKGVQGRRNLNALKDLGSWTSKEAEKAEQKRIEEEIIQKLQGYGQQLQSLDPNSSEYQRVYSEMLLAVKDVTGYIQYMKEATATPDMMAQYDSIMKGLEYANQLGAFQAATGTDMYQTAQPLLQSTFGGDYGQTTEQIPNIAGGMTGEGISDITRPTTGEELWGGIVNTQKEAIENEKYKQNLSLQNQELSNIKLKADIDKTLNDQERVKVNEAIAYINSLLDDALGTSNPDIAELLLSIDRIPINMQQTLKRIGLLPEGSTTIIPAAKAIIANAENQQDMEALTMKIKVDQNEREWAKFFLDKEKFEYTKTQDLNDEGKKDEYELTTNDMSYVYKVLFGQEMGQFEKMFGAMLADNGLSMGQFDEQVRDGYITRLENGEFATPEEMWNAYKRDMEPYNRIIRNPTVANKIVQTMVETIQGKGYVVPKEMTAYLGGGGSTATPTTQDPSVTAMIEKIKTVSPEEAKQGWKEDRETAIEMWNNQGKNGEALAKEIDAFLSGY